MLQRHCGNNPDTMLHNAITPLNNRFKINEGWTKNILRKSVESILPFDVIWRKNKMGFEAPEKTWLEEIEKDIKNTIQNSIILKEICIEIPYELLDNTQKWKLFNVAKWENIYNVNIKGDTIK